VLLGEALEAAEVSRLLCCEADQSHRTGERISSRSAGLWKHGGWSVKDHLPPTESLSAKIEHVLDRVTTDKEVWRALTRRFEARLFCGIFLNNPEKLGELVCLPADLLKRAADLGLELVLDVWPPASVPSSGPASAEDAPRG